MAKITVLSLYIINQVKLRRLILGFSARYLSILLEHFEGYISRVEDEKYDSQFPVSEWPSLAKALDFTIHDLLPPDNMNYESDGTLTDKKILSLKKEEDVLLVIKGLLEYNFFNEEKSLEDVAQHLLIDEKEEETAMLKAAIAVAVRNGLLSNNSGSYSRIQ